MFFVFAWGGGGCYELIPFVEAFLMAWLLFGWRDGVGKMNTLWVSHGDVTYPIYIGHGLLTNKALLSSHVVGHQVCMVSNKDVAALYLSSLEKQFLEKSCLTHLFKEGESHKTLDELRGLWDALIDAQFHRDATLVALGGGVVGDMTGFAAACYLRGVPFIQVPTTLLAQTDASIGGKTAVDHPKGKNLIGAFYSPSAVFADLGTLDTLSDRVFRSGLVEVIKHALIHDADFFDWLEYHLSKIIQREPVILQEMLTRSCQIKIDIVSQDEKETSGVRALLNLGHTFGHVVEQFLNFSKWQHGEAVALGIRMSLVLSAHRSWLGAKEIARVNRVLDLLEMPSCLPVGITYGTFRSTLWNDKKVMRNQLCFIALKGIGQAALTMDVSEKELSTLLAAFEK